MKKEITEEEIQARQAEATFNRLFAGFKRTLQTQIEKEGLRKTKLQLEFLQKYPNTKSPKEYFTVGECIDAYKEVIQGFENDNPTQTF